ncbi:PREDICTED: uncharacterized protein LOC109586613 [Amphimedon queenslandica]|uniref:MD-2-related lipid-recognition domain-containing protein n=1 Tax=Amphimedon queenslandica TaxID=400682 RepID=A0AAN0JMZ3_AMPQE|nr:PREDICTED: uncharacterized protein LOC109586613 [Amphimedon queenslandica]|eukprot:XP_019858368.1 PREDICTED: uncharacterized protein LOC109586613 [Amphimedon queenslandica]
MDCSTSHDFGEITNVTSNTFGKTVKPGQNYIIRGIIKLKKELKWGTLHQTMTHQFKNIINLAIEDAKYNLCDIISSLTATGESGVYCPLKPGIYHGLYNSTIPSLLLLWPVSNNTLFKIIILIHRASIALKSLLMMRITMKYFVQWQNLILKNNKS